MGSLLKDSVVSFFKIMIDHDFLNVLYLPPKLARITSNLLNKKTYLENLNGRRWNVVVSEENGSLAFRKGWSEFSMAHNLGIGDLVVFHYFLGQYFLVQVFNKSACDLRGLMLGNGYPSTRSRSETNSVDTSPLQARYGISGSQEDSPGKGDSNDSVISASEKRNEYTPEIKNATDVHPLSVVDKKADPPCFEDPEVQFITIHRDNTSYEPRADRTVIDLSNYEIPSADIKSNIKLSGNAPFHPTASTVVECKTEPDMTEFSNPKKEINCHVGVSESNKRKEVERSLYSDVKKKKHNAPTIGSPSWTTMSPKYESDVKKKKYDAPAIGSPSSTVTPLEYESDFPKLTAPNSVYRAEESNTPFQNGNPVVKIKKEVKTEPFEETGLGLVTASASDLHCTIRNATAMCLELPGSLPLFTSWRGTSGQKLVILRDQAENFWPVFYHHKPSTKLLTTGWPAFVKANNIQSGDECIFKADAKDNATYDVSIVRKRDRPT